ncbi:MAG: helix-turn-helix transcriptional regulator [Planctomycetes bacterium]|nr:helix-turn-helix transcriptional regulator [Planctomycetota bacterium]
MKKVSDTVSIMSKIHDAIRKAIAKSEKTRYRLWQETGISQAQLCEFLHGRRGMSIEYLETLAQALGLEITVRPAKRKKGR